MAASFDIESGKGVLIAQVSEDSPARKAGLNQVDIIVAYQGKVVTDIERE